MSWSLVFHPDVREEHQKLIKSFIGTFGVLYLGAFLIASTTEFIPIAWKL